MKTLLTKHIDYGFTHRALPTRNSEAVIKSTGIMFPLPLPEGLIIIALGNTHCFILYLGNTFCNLLYLGNTHCYILYLRKTHFNFLCIHPVPCPVNHLQPLDVGDEPLQLSFGVPGPFHGRKRP